jgi:MoaA/NifB/PqqE/SkfB family radical SAM enzyme
MTRKLIKRFWTETDKRLLFKFVYNFGWKGMRAVRRFQKRIKKGEYFPAFLFLSVTNNCNLHCQGCWVTPTKPVRELDVKTLDRIITECKDKGSYFFGILGGEPLLHSGLFECLENHPDCYFLLFTNGTLITDTLAGEMNRLGNISPLISIEGNETVSDHRRGGHRVFSRTMQGIEYCRKHGLITGVATSVCKSNIEDLVTEDFVENLTDIGVHYLWYYIYRPVGPNPSPELVLSQDEVIRLRRFIVDIRNRVPLLVVDAYWDHRGQALCPAATGISHHIGPGGDVEPCPPIQFARDCVLNGKTLSDVFTQSEFLSNFRHLASRTTRGCILMERPDLLKAFVQETQAWDSSGRRTALKELSSMDICPSHHVKGEEIPEASWPYRFAKKHWFFGFGAYG